MLCILSIICFPSLFDGYPRELPHPDVEWEKFEGAVSAALGKEAEAWNPLTRRNESWINMTQLRRAYGPKGGCIMS